MRFAALVLALVACGGTDDAEVMAPTALPVCADPTPPIGDIAGEYALYWRCLGVRLDGANPLDELGPCAPAENPWRDGMTVSVYDVSDARVRVDIGGISTEAYRLASGVEFWPATDAGQERTGGSIERCTAAMLLLRMSWRTLADDGDVSWYAVLTPR